MKNKYPIYIITKGRSESCLTARELTQMKVDFALVVEPQEVDQYRKNYPHCQIISTPFKNLGQGSIPARNFVLDHARRARSVKHWILDDNIEGFHRLNRNEKYKVADGTIFRCCEDFTDRYENVKLSGMNYHSFCKASDAVPPFYLNTRIYSCILIDNSINHAWRGKFNEDTDLSLRVLKDGDCTILFNAFLIGKVTTMRMKGGNTGDVYGDTDNRREFAESLQKQHPDCVKVVWKFGRWHHSVDYSKFKRNEIRRFKWIKRMGKVNNYGMYLTKDK